MVEQQLNDPENIKQEGSTEDQTDASHKTYWKEVQEKTCNVVKSNKICSIVSAIMILGILIAIKSWFVGSLFIGCALGVNYIKLIKSGLVKIFENFKAECYFNKFFLIVVAIAIFITNFPLLIGGIIGIGIKTLVSFKSTPKKEKVKKPEKTVEEE